MVARFWTSLILKLACAATVAWLVALMYEKGVRPVRDVVDMFRRLPKVSRVLLGAFFVGMWLFASIKPDGDGNGESGTGNGGDGGTNSVQIVIGPGGGLQPLDSPGAVTNDQQQGLQGGIQPPQGGMVVASAPVTDERSNFAPITSTNTTRTLTGDDFRRGFVMSRVGTDEQFDFAAPSNAVVCADWRAFGAATDWIYVAFTNWAFQVSTNDVGRLRVYAFGKIEPLIRETDSSIATNYWFAPFMASLGIVPETNWDWLSESERSSQLWHYVTPSNTLQITWQNALLDRDTDTPVSFQIEFRTDGQFTYRYDLSRLNVDAVTNALAGAAFAGNAWTTNAIPADVTSMTFYPLSAEDAVNQDPDEDGLPTIDELFVYNTDPRNADTDYDGLSDYEELFVYNSDPLNPNSISAAYCDGFAARLGDLDPFACPEGSTNTIYEHIFYTGTTNAPFAYPTSTVETAVLRVMVSGTGAGDLIIGDTVVPLVAPPQTRSGSQTNTLLVSVGRGRPGKAFWFRKPDGLEVAIDSDDFLIGEVPTWYKPRGWIAFPHTESTVPCIHDFNGNRKYMTLIHGEEFPGMTAEWSGGGDDVMIVNEQRICANVYGTFPRDQTRSIFYTVGHPDYICGTTNYAQTLSFCPKLTDMEASGLGGGGAFGDGEGWTGHWSCSCLPDVLCDCCPGDVCDCPAWNCPCGNNRAAALGDATEEEATAEAYTNIVNGTQTELLDVLYLYRSNVRSEFLEVPNGPARECCPCPEHRQTNYVARAYKSSRVAVRDQGGGDFEIGYEPCTVAISGVSPSLRFGDSPVLFVTNGAAYKRIDCTVLGVKFELPDNRPPLSRYNQLSPQFGYPFVVCTNLLNAVSLRLKTDVVPTNGLVRISMSDVAGDVALWLPEWWDSHGAWHPAEPLLQAGVKEERFIPIRRWRSLLRRCSYESNSLEVKLLASTTGGCTLRLDYVASDGTRYVHDFAEQRVTAVKPPLLVDYNQDSLLDALDTA